MAALRISIKGLYQPAQSGCRLAGGPVVNLEVKIPIHVYPPPTSSYEIDLPDDAQTKFDNRVTSIWRADISLALQLSSAVMYAEPRSVRGERLRDRIQRTGGSWQAVTVILNSADDADVAAAQTSDQTGSDWLHVYITWPDVFVYATVSGPTSKGPLVGTWAAVALQSIRRRAPRWYTRDA